MKLGIAVLPGAGTTELAKQAEAAGFDSVWFVESPMLFGDAYVAMGAAAAVTERIQLATGVTNPVLRAAPIVAASFATLAVNSPGRIIMGVGTGFTATGALGLGPATLAQMRAFVDQVRALLRGEVIHFVFPNGVEKSIGFLNTTLPWLDTSARVPVYVAGSAPKSLATAATLGDSVMIGGITSPELIAECIERVRRARSETGLDPDAVGFAITPATYLTDHDVDLDDPDDFEELREIIGPKSLAPAQNFSRLAEISPRVPDRLTEQLVAMRAAYKPTAVDPDSKTAHMAAYRGYVVELKAEQRKLVTPDILRATSLVGSPRQVNEKLAMLASAGITHVVLSPLASLKEETIQGFGEHVIPGRSTWSPSTTVPDR